MEFSKKRKKKENYYEFVRLIGEKIVSMEF